MTRARFHREGRKNFCTAEDAEGAEKNQPEQYRHPTRQPLCAAEDGPEAELRKSAQGAADVEMGSYQTRFTLPPSTAYTPISVTMKSIATSCGCG